VYTEATGFDAGLSHLSCVKIVKKGERFRVTRAGFIHSLNPLDDPDFKRTFRGFTRDKRIHPKNLVVGLSGRSVMVRYLKVPVVPDWKLDMMMDFEIDEQTSRFTKDSFWAYRKVSVPGIRKYNVMMIGVCSHDYIEYFLEQIPHIESFNLNSLALYSASLLSDQIEEDSFSLIIDIGAYNTEVAVVRGDMLLFGRNIQYGSNNFDEDIITALNIDISEADKLKVEKGCVRSGRIKSDEDTDAEKQLNATLTASARMLYTHISSALQYCKDQIGYYDFDLDHIFTTGGGSLLKGLNEFLGEKFGVPVDHLSITDKLDLNGLSEKKKEEFENHIHSFTTAVGLAISVIHPKAAALNPMPERIIKRRRFFNREFYLIAASVIFVALLTLWGWVVFSHYRKIDEQISTKKRLLNDAHNLQQKISIEERLYSRYSEMEKALKERVYSSTDMLTIFNILQSTLPDDIWITSFSTEDIGTIVEEEEKGKQDIAPATIQNRGTIYISGQVRVGNGLSLDPHQLLDDYTTRLKNDYKQFSKFIPMAKEYTDNKDSFYYKYKILISNVEAGNVLEK
jgi:Tfp pilus assembly PilM family ATPase